MKSLAYVLLVPLAACVASNPGGDDPIIDDGKADGTTATYFDCEGLGTNHTTWLAISKTQKSVKLTIEDAGVNTGKLTTSGSDAHTYGNWSSKVFFDPGDTLVIPDSLMTTGSGTVVWNIANVNPHWEGTCTKKSPTGDQCMPLVEQVFPVDSEATASYTKESSGHYAMTIPDAAVGAFTYAIDMSVSGLLCMQGDITPTSCSAIVADKIGTKAIKDGSSSGQPYVTSRTKTASGYSWAGGVHDDESGEFAYTVTTSSNADDCSVTSIRTVPQ